MKVDLTYTNRDTGRKRTLKKVPYLGRAHARALIEAVEGTINHPLPAGFRITMTASYNPVIRTVDRRKVAKEARKEMPRNRREATERLADKTRFFKTTLTFYTETTKEHPRARTISFRDFVAVLFSGEQDFTISGRMSGLKTLLKQTGADDTTYDGIPSYVIGSNNLDIFLQWLLENIQYEGNRATYDYIMQHMETHPDLITVIQKGRIQRNIETLSPGVTPGFQDAADIPVGRGQPLLSSRFIRYDIKPSDTFLGLFDLPPQTRTGEDTCLYDTVFQILERDEMWQKRRPSLWEDIRKDPYRFMWSINHPGEPFPEGKLPMATLREFYPMFDLLRKDLKVFDVRARIWLSRHPKKTTYKNGQMTYILDEDGDPIETCPDNNSRCKCLAFVLHSHHVYLINRPFVVKGKDDLAAEHYYEPLSADGGKTTDYVLPIEQKEEENEEASYRPSPPMVVYTDEEGTWYDRMAAIVSKTGYSHYQFFTGDNILQSGMELFQDTAYEAGVVAQGQDLVHGLKIMNFWRGDVQLSISLRPFPCYLKKHVCPYTEEAAELLRSYMDEAHNMKLQLLTRMAMSEYSDETRKLLRYYKMGGTSDYYSDDFKPGFKALGLDFNKFYPWVMCRWEQVQAFSAFDRPIQYDEHPIEAYTLYEVEQLEPTRCYSGRAFHMAYGSTLLRLPEDHPPYRIISFIRPSKIVPSNFAESVKALLSRTDIDIRVLKTLLASMSGTLGMSYYKRHGSTMLFDAEEAGHYMALMGERALVQSKEVDRIGKVYIVSEDRKTELHSGFDPLYMRVIDEAMLEVHLLEQRLRKLGYPVLGRKVDNVYLDVAADDEAMKERLRSDLGDLIQNGQTGYEAFGLLKFEEKVLPDGQKPKANDPHNKRLFHKCGVTEPVKHEVDEWDEESMFEKLDELREAGKHTQILADVPGAGKTTLAVRYAKSRGLKVALLAYMNKTVFLRRADFDGYEGATLSTISYLKEAGQMNLLKEVDAVIVDEWATTPIAVLTPLKRIMSDIKWLVVTSDVHQNPAINVEYNAIEDVHEYYTRLTDDICRDVIHLKEPKRSRCPCHQKGYSLADIRDCKECATLREKAKEIVRGILDAPTDKDAVNFVLQKFKRVNWLEDLPEDTLAVSYFQHTRARLNKYFHDRVSKVPYYVGQTLVCRKRWVKTIQKERHSIHVNYEVEVVAVNEKKIMLLEPLTEWEFEMTKDEVDKHFLYSHAGTCHALQGATHEGPIAVFDIWSTHVTRNWLLVAVTRNKDLSQTVVYTGAEVKQLDVSLRAKIEGMIKSHREADKKAGRNWQKGTYITPEDVMKLMETVRVCPVCGTDDIGAQNWSLDRIDSELPHVKGNCQLLCSGSCNSAKKKKHVSS